MNSCCARILFFILFYFTNLYAADVITSETININNSEESIPIQFPTTSEVNPEEKKAIEYPSLYKNFLSYFLKIIFILIFFIVIFILFKKFYKKKIIHSDIEEVIKVIGIKPISHNKYLQLIQFGNRYLLLGITDNNIIKISEIINKEEVDNIKLQLNIENKETNFSNILNTKTGNEDDTITKFKKQLNELLKKK
ncbi:MAG TPA: flagellar biosynthetic protein FliO [bacterium]|nr:flagellar biosynthetic protein FliO [bacterium]HPQ18240.1 flagellar biosynthetic protein FliO [bacterium]